MPVITFYLGLVVGSMFYTIFVLCPELVGFIANLLWCDALHHLTDDPVHHVFLLESTFSLFRNHLVILQ